MEYNWVFIWGDTLHTKSIISVIGEEKKWQIKAVISSNKEAKLLIEQNIKRCIIAIEDNRLRHNKYLELMELGAEFINVIHPTSHVASDVIMGGGCFVHANVTLEGKVSMGNNVILEANTGIAHDALLGDAIHLGSCATIGGGANVGNYTFIGAHSVVLPGAQVGCNVTIKENVLVNKKTDDVSIIEARRVNLIDESLLDKIV